MGIFLSTPKTDKESEEGTNGVLAYGASAMQGWRRSMEDTHIACLALPTETETEGSGSPPAAAAPSEFAIFGVFDGHGGTEVSKFVEAHLKEELVALPEFKAGKFDEALRRAFHRMDELLSTREGILEELEGYRRAADESASSGAQSHAKKARTKRSASEGDELALAGEDGANGGGGENGGENGGEKRGISAAEAIDWFQKLLVNSEAEKAEKAKSAAAVAASADGSSSSTAAAAAGGGAGGDAGGGSSASGAAAAAAAAAEGAESASLGEGKLDEEEEMAVPTPTESLGFPRPLSFVERALGGRERARAGAAPVAGEDGGASASAPQVFKGKYISCVAEQDDIDPNWRHQFAAGVRGTPDPDPGPDVKALLRLGQPQCTLAEHEVPSGCTSVVALIAGDKLYVANAGDSRAMIVRGGMFCALSNDHKPQQQRELDRIQAAGGFVTAAGRVNGNLNLSRSIGDLKYKQNKDLPPESQIITAEPDVTRYSISPEDEFLVLACDGVWDCMTTEQVAFFVRQRLQKNKLSPAQVCEAVFDLCIAEDPHHAAGLGGDNMTMVIVCFSPPATWPPPPVPPPEDT